MPSAQGSASEDGGRLSRPRQLGLAGVLVFAIGVLVRVVEPYHPVADWLVWRLAGYWLLCAFWALGCLSVGHALLGRLLRRPPPRGDRMVLGFALGVYVFHLLLWVAGLLGLLGPALFVGLPLVLAAVGAPGLWREARHAAAVEGARRQSRPGPGWGTWALQALGGLGVLVLYLQILTPDHIGYDGRWYHQAIAEHYVAQGRIAAFPEGWWLGIYPQLGSLLYTWAYLLPAPLYDRIELAAHLEFTFFLATLAGIPVLARRLLHGRRLPAAWVAVFLYPEIFNYDSNLNGGADHIAAFWAVPIFLALLRAYKKLAPRECALLAVMLSGVVLTKYTGAGLLLAGVLALGYRAVRLLAQGEAGLRPLRGFAVLAGVGLACTAPHWAKNLVWYGDPLYPFLHAYLPLHPWTPESPSRMAYMTLQDMVAERSFAGVAESLVRSVTFSFAAYDWADFHGEVPLFGFLFTLLLPCLLFLRRNTRLWGLALAIQWGIFFWYLSFHHLDRFLQQLVPWMAAFTACVLVELWQQTRVLRGLVLALVGLQVAWGGQALFLPSHPLLGRSGLAASVEFLGLGPEQRRQRRQELYGPVSQVRNALPPDAKLLIHEFGVHLGFGRPSVNDWVITQGGISYVQHARPSEMYELYRHLGVTHLIWMTGLSRGQDTLGGDLAFFTFAFRYAQPASHFAGYALAALPDARPIDHGFFDRALLLGCDGGYAPGLYAISNLDVTESWEGRPASAYPPPRQPVSSLAQAEALLDGVDAVVYRPACWRRPAALAKHGFVQVATRVGDEIWVRRRAGAGS